MKRKDRHPGAFPVEAVVPAGLRSRAWKRFLRGPDPSLLEELYVPALSEAVRYDRCCAYFSSTVLSAAARGFGRLIERLELLGRKAPRPAVRLVINEEMAEEDVRTLVETGETSGLEAQLLRRFRNPVEGLEKDRLAMLGWLAKQGLLEVRVGVMRRGGGIMHAKFGIATDQAGDAIAFSGSGNESAQGLVGNYERLDVSTSWEDPERHREYASEFAALWTDAHSDVHTVTLPEALRQRLIRFASRQAPMVEPTQALARQKAGMVWRFLIEAPYLANGDRTCDASAMVDLWPHQRRVVEETAGAWPAGRLLCDEVGMGKTIEAILILRRLLAGRGVSRALVLLPKGLLKQWQGELREKGGMAFPRLEGTGTLVWPDDHEERVAGLADALEQDVLLLSRETARTESNQPILLAARPWDLVILDESHAARRRKQEEGEFNSGTLLLTLLRQLVLRRRTRGVLLLSATPMQTHPWEPWDLMSVLGEGGAWLADFSGVRDFYASIAAVRRGHCDRDRAQRAASLIASDLEFPAPPEDLRTGRTSQSIADTLLFAPPSKGEALADWMRRGSPLARRMHRNTRATLQQYFESGLLPHPPPRRSVEDVLFDFDDPAERRVYNAVSQYIERRFEELEREKPGKGFVMTVYRRRASSSPLALERSLERRRKTLERVANERAYDTDLEPLDVPEALDVADLPDEEAPGRVSAALPQDPEAARAEIGELDRVLSALRELRGRDSKRDFFFRVLRRVTDDGRAVLVFTEYTDTLEYLRDQLVAFYRTALGCYSGEGGQRWDGTEWKMVTKDAITSALQAHEVRVLICSDAASEGLNLQAAGAVINYDLPWNPSRVEQRIGRIDRIGQVLPDVRVVNLFLRDSVDDRVYRALRERCGLFEHFVGAMQPVLARARRMLMGQEPADPGAITVAAEEVRGDPILEETYLESPAGVSTPMAPPASRQDLLDNLTLLNGLGGYRLVVGGGGRRFRLSGPKRMKRVFSGHVEELERDRGVAPLSPLDPGLRRVVEALWKAGERLPLILGACQRGAFRAVSAYWLEGGTLSRIESMQDLQDQIRAWTGTCPDADAWVRGVKAAEKEAADRVAAMVAHAEERQREGLQKQVAAARLRLQREVGRFLVCLGADPSDLNGAFHIQLSREIATARRLRAVLDRLGGYPQWDEPLRRELEDFRDTVTDHQRKARLTGREIEAALEDPRWAAEI